LKYKVLNNPSLNTLKQRGVKVECKGVAREGRSEVSRRRNLYRRTGTV